MVGLLVINWNHLLPKISYLHKHVNYTPIRLELNSATYETYNSTAQLIYSIYESFFA